MFSSPPTDTISLKLKNTFTLFHSLLLGSYYNTSLLAQSVNATKSYHSTLLLPQGSAQQIRSLCANAEIEPYIRENQLEPAVDHLYRTMDMVISPGEEMHRKLIESEELLSQIRKDSVELVAATRKVDEARVQEGEEYKKASTEFNFRNDLYSSRVARYNSLVTEINAYRQKPVTDSLAAAFVRCIIVDALMQK
jgi:50S ribosomal subunit-associated GTPase HflX